MKSEKFLLDIKERLENVLNEMKGRNFVRAFDAVNDLRSIVDFNLLTRKKEFSDESEEGLDDVEV